MRRWSRWAFGALGVGFGYLAYVYLTLPDVRVLASRNPESTAFIELRRDEAHDLGRSFNLQRRWVPYPRISNHLKRAVIVAEDSAFFEHEGLDYEQIRESIEHSLEDGAAIRGASTITQQLAKNLYLSESRNPVRKLRELIITRRLEAALTKRRIFEIYLNSIEWGDGIFGCEAAARAYFGKSAAALSASESALLAGAIINPRVHSPARPTRRLLRRQQIILGRMGGVEPPPNAPAPASGPIDDDTPDDPPPDPPADSPLPADPPPADPPPADPPVAPLPPAPKLPPPPRP
jgi:monofunctional glycosyltransferase